MTLSSAVFRNRSILNLRNFIISSNDEGVNALVAAELDDAAFLRQNICNIGARSLITQNALCSLVFDWLQGDRNFVQITVYTNFLANMQSLIEGVPGISRENVTSYRWDSAELNRPDGAKMRIRVYDGRAPLAAEKVYSGRALLLCEPCVRLLRR